MRKINLLFIGIGLLLCSCSTDDSDISPEDESVFEENTRASANIADTSNSIPKKNDPLERDKKNLISLVKNNLALQNLNWSLEIDITEWERIKIKKNRVVNLDLSWMNLNEFPNEIKKLKRLESLYLNNNNIEDSIPKFLGKLPSLRLINLSGNKLNTIPKNIASAPKLRVLLLQNNKLNSIPAEIGKLNLLIFSIKKNPMLHIPSEICEAFDFTHPNFSKDTTVVCQKKVTEELEEVEEL